MDVSLYPPLRQERYLLLSYIILSYTDTRYLYVYLSHILESNGIDMMWYHCLILLCICNAALSAMINKTTTLGTITGVSADINGTEILKFKGQYIYCCRSSVSLLVIVNFHVKCEQF